MSRPNALLAVALAALLVTAGCLGGTAGPGANGGETSTDSDEATVSFYVSDRPGAIDQFEHLNVTITAVGFHQADEGGDDANESDDSEELNESEDGDDANETEDDVETTASPTDANETTTTTTEAPDADDDADDEEAESENESDAEDADNESDDGGEAGPRDSEGWITHDVDNRTVDLTELQGANASRLADFNVSEGEYDKVFVYIGEVEGTLNSGEEVDVHLPSSRLHINKGFTVERGSNVSFVFDIMVHEAGNSGRYVLRPVIGESGTGDEVEINDVNADDGDGERGPPADAGPGNDDDERDAENESDDEREDEELALAVDGAVRAGETVTVTVTGADGAPVGNATVTVQGEQVGTTAADGTIELTVPEDAEELEVTVTKGDSEGESSWPVRGDGNGNELLPLA